MSYFFSTIALLVLLIAAVAALVLRWRLTANRPHLALGSAWLTVCALLAFLLLPLARGAELPRVPAHSVPYRIAVTREAVRWWGLDAPAARIAAQLHQESAWRPDAQSPYAQGLAQFTPATAAWLPDVCPEVGPPDPWDASWSIRAVACYDHWLWRRVRPMGDGAVDPCSRWAFALRAYNGGEGWIARERRATLAVGDSPDDWQAVERHRLRATWAHSENTRYPRRILLVLEPVYRAAGWDGTAVCP